MMLYWAYFIVGWAIGLGGALVGLYVTRRF